MTADWHCGTAAGRHATHPAGSLRRVRPAGIGIADPVGAVAGMALAERASSMESATSAADRGIGRVTYTVRRARVKARARRKVRTKAKARARARRAMKASSEMLRGRRSPPRVAARAPCPLRGLPRAKQTTYLSKPLYKVNRRLFETRGLIMQSSPSCSQRRGGRQVLTIILENKIIPIVQPAPRWATRMPGAP